MCSSKARKIAELACSTSCISDVTAFSCNSLKKYGLKSSYKVSRMHTFATETTSKRDLHLFSRIIFAASSINFETFHFCSSSTI